MGGIFPRVCLNGDSYWGLIVNPKLGIVCETNRVCSRGQPYFSVFNAYAEGIEGQPPIALHVAVVCRGLGRSDIM